MATETSATTRTRRPYVGFDREEAVYARLKPELLKTAEGQYVVFVGEERGRPRRTPTATRRRAGYRRFGKGPRFCQVRLLAEEPVAPEISPRHHPMPTVTFGLDHAGRPVIEL